MGAPTDRSARRNQRNDISFRWRLCSTAEAVPFPVRIRVNVKINVKGDGQECPSHTIKVPALSPQKARRQGRGIRHAL
jgi:hypothetical protein